MPCFDQEAGCGSQGEEMSYSLPSLKRLGGCRPLPPRARFESSYMPEPMSGCWLWLGAGRGSNKYGVIKVEGKPTPAHRYSYEIHRGPIPKGMFVCHRCDIPLCVNPSHLFLGDAQSNSDDKVSKGRQARGEMLAIRQQHLSGEENGNSRLTKIQVEEIRASSLPQREIAVEYGVSQALISKIKRKEIWK